MRECGYRQRIFAPIHSSRAVLPDCLLYLSGLKKRIKSLEFDGERNLNNADSNIDKSHQVNNVSSYVTAVNAKAKKKIDKNAPIDQDTNGTLE